MTAPFLFVLMVLGSTDVIKVKQARSTKHKSRKEKRRSYAKLQPEIFKHVFNPKLIVSRAS